MFNMPKSTMQDRLTGRVVFGSKSGPESYLSEQEEKEIITFIESPSDIGYSRSKAQIIALVQQVLHDKGKKDVKVSSGWWSSFRQRHPQLTLRTAEPVSLAHASGTKPEILERCWRKHWMSWKFVANHAKSLTWMRQGCNLIL